MSTFTHDVIVDGVVFSFVRRRYGRKTFTWVHYQDEQGKWHEYVGDPWPSVKVPKRDLQIIAQELKGEKKAGLTP